MINMRAQFHAGDVVADTILVTGHGACLVTLNDASGSLNCFPAHSIGCPHLCGRNTTRSNMAGYRYAEFACRVVQQNISSCCRADHLALAWIHGSTN